MTDKQEIMLPEPDGYVCHEGRMAPSGGYEAGFGFSLSKPEDVEGAIFPYEAAPVFFDATVRRLIAEAVAAERAKNIAALEALNRWDYDDPASSAIAAIRARSAAKSAGELPPTDRSSQGPAHPSLCAVDDAAASGGLACDRVPERVPPDRLEREGFVPASDHQSVRGDVVRGPGVLGGLEGERPDDGGMAKGVSDVRGS